MSELHGTTRHLPSYPQPSVVVTTGQRTAAGPPWRRPTRTAAWLLAVLGCVVVMGCASRYSIKRALLSGYTAECPQAKAVDSGKKDCDGLPIFVLWCAGKPVHEEAIWCHKGDCFTEQMAGRCWK